MMAEVTPEDHKSARRVAQARTESHQGSQADSSRVTLGHSQSTHKPRVHITNPDADVNDASLGGASTTAANDVAQPTPARTLIQHTDAEEVEYVTRCYLHLTDVAGSFHPATTTSRRPVCLNDEMYDCHVSCLIPRMSCGGPVARESRRHGSTSLYQSTLEGFNIQTRSNIQRNMADVKIPSSVPEEYRPGYLPPSIVDQSQDNKPGLQAPLKPAPFDDVLQDGSKYKAAGKLQGKNAVITGGDSGIGRAVAIL
jgi:hypothetical protein